MVIRDWLSSIMNEMMNIKRAGKEEVIFMPFSKLIIEILKIMKKEEYVKEYKIEEYKFKKIIIKIGKLNKCGAIKPRFFVKKDEFDKYVKRYLPSRHFGIIIVSTSKGIMTHKEAIEKEIGGCLLAYCY
jgi:small subunit ribosomal protein S8